MSKDTVHERIEDRRTELVALTRDIWENPELGLQETDSAELLADALAAEGFTVDRGVGGMETAFVASYGTGGPAIGILGEYDALPGLSQKSVARREPVEEGAPGHGCGHNLFGVGSLGAAVAIREAIERGDLDGTIRYYGCPAEETLVGKVYLARAGAFDDLDAALTWHPSQVSAPWKSRSLAMNSIEYTFRGQSAHAADSPESGRSALDAVELMNTGAEFMREHVTDDARLHYSITNGGGAPNVVPAEASVWYFVRAPTRAQVDRITDWLDDVAEGATLMSQTTVERRFLTGCYDYIANDVLSDALLANMRELGSIPYTDEDREFAAELRDTLDAALDGIVRRGDRVERIHRRRRRQLDHARRAVLVRVVAHGHPLTHLAGGRRQRRLRREIRGLRREGARGDCLRSARGPVADRAGERGAPIGAPARVRKPAAGDGRTTHRYGSKLK